MTTDTQADIIVIGAGIAGASIASELAGRYRTILLEMESQAGYHTTGRSAAMFVPTYGPAPIRALTEASASFFHNSHRLFSGKSLLSPRQVLMIARTDQTESLEQLKKEVAERADITEVGSQQILEHCPLLKPDYAHSGFLDTGAFDIDVAALHQSYLRQFKNNSGQLFTDSSVLALGKHGDDWRIDTGRQTFTAPLVVNAAGAWADDVNVLAGFDPVGLVPKRRTMVVIEPPKETDLSSMAMTIDVDEQFFLKPEKAQILISPADETPSPPCDAQPEELDIAICVDRIEKAFDLPIRRVQSSWAGLRSFVEDKVPAAGFLKGSNSFFLLAGQGGYGIQTSPALSRFSACLLTGQPLPNDISDLGVTTANLAPGRLA